MFEADDAGRPLRRRSGRAQGRRRRARSIPARTELVEDFGLQLRLSLLNSARAAPFLVSNHLVLRRVRDRWRIEFMHGENRIAPYPQFVTGSTLPISNADPRSSPREHLCIWI